MKSIILLAIAFAVNAAPKSPTLIHPTDVSSNGNEGRIIYGIDARPGEFIWQVKVYFKDQFICSGNMLNHRFILTAAHCIGEPAEFYKILIGSLKINELHEYNIAETIPHENYGNFVNDIGLMYTKENIIYYPGIEQARPVNLPMYHLLPNPNECFYVSGWGHEEREGGKYSFSLMYLCPKVIEQSECGRLTGVSHPGTFCMSGVICHGDSGAPVSNSSTIYGVANFIVEGCKSGFPDGFANVFYYKDWIERTMDLYEYEKDLRLE